MQVKFTFAQQNLSACLGYYYILTDYNLYGVCLLIDLSGVISIKCIGILIKFVYNCNLYAYLVCLVS